MYIKKILLVLFIFFGINHSLFADNVYYLDFRYILNESNAGKKAQTSLKNKLEKGIQNLKNKEKKIQDEEKKLIQQKKIISEDDYKKQIGELRSKVNSLQKERNKLLETVAKQRNKAKNELLKNLNPIMKAYMSEKKIKIVIDKKQVLLGDDTLDITKDIIALLNKKLKSINLN